MSEIRNKLIELIAKAKRSMWGKKGMSCELARNSFVAEYLLANGVTVQRWIPVTERLPEHGEIVLCHMSFKEARMLQWDGVSQCWLGFGRGDDWSKAYITHWMPLPSTEGLE